MVRNLYKFRNGTVIAEKAYTYNEFEGTYDCTIDGASADETAVWNKVSDIDANKTVLIKQVFPNV